MNTVKKVSTVLIVVVASTGAWEQGQHTWSLPWSWQSPIPEAQLGLCVASGGDVNGDGIDDMVFAAPYDATGGIELGTIYVLFGSSTGWGPELDVSKTAVASFRGEAYRDHPGGAEEGGSAGLAIVQSINGDIYDEIVVASPGNDDAGVDHGKVYVIYGKSEGWAEIDTLSNADATYLGETFLGETPRLVIASAGDVNGDGKGDILVGAPTIGTGKVYLILGNESRPKSSRSLADADASFVGEMDATGLGRAGFSVSGVPDLNDDGRDEILIGAPKFSPDFGSLFMGKAYLILGRATGWTLNDTLSNADVSFMGVNSGDEVGFTVRGVGDMDSDGKGDFLVSSRVGTGHVYLILGSSISAPASNVPITDADTHFLCADISTGDAMTPLGDVNGDTYDDFALGAPFYDAGPGKAYAVLGREIWPSELVMEETEGGWKGTSSKFWAGSSVAGGDVNDDGRPDLVIGAGADPFAGFDAGSVFVVPSNYAGDTTPPERTTDLDAGYDVSGHATLTWSQVTQDANGQPEAVLFYRVLRHKHDLIDEPETRVYSLPAVLDPETTAADTADVVGDVNFFYYYRILTIDESGNVSEPSTGTGAFDFLLEFPQD